jgi:hypothetical protein
MNRCQGCARCFHISLLAFVAQRTQQYYHAIMQTLYVASSRHTSRVAVKPGTLYIERNSIRAVLLPVVPQVS